MPKKKPTFESDLSRLSEIVEQVEDSETQLDDAIKLYKEGLALAVKCNELLTNYEKEILVLQKNANSAFFTSPFEE